MYEDNFFGLVKSFCYSYKFALVQNIPTGNSFVYSADIQDFVLHESPTLILGNILEKQFESYKQQVMPNFNPHEQINVMCSITSYSNRAVTNITCVFENVPGQSIIVHEPMGTKTYFPGDDKYDWAAEQFNSMRKYTSTFDTSDYKSMPVGWDYFNVGKNAGKK